MAKSKQRQRGRSDSGRRPLNRRLTWREVESAFDHLFDVSLTDDRAQRLLVQIRRARAQLYPLLINMLVSPYERERALAGDVLLRIGGPSTTKLLDELLEDDDVYEAYKLGIRRLKTELVDRGRRRVGKRDDRRGDRRDERDAERTPRPRTGRKRRGETTGRSRDEQDIGIRIDTREVSREVSRPADTGEPAAEDKATKGKAGRARRGKAARPEARPEAAPAAEVTPTDAKLAGPKPKRGAKERAPEPVTEGPVADTPTADTPTADTPTADTPAVEPPVPVTPALFEEPAEKFLVALTGPVEPLIAVFAGLDEAARVSFLDRVSRLGDRRIGRFLAPLLATDDFASVHSSLDALADLGYTEALPAVEALAEAGRRKNVRERAARVAETLRQAAARQPEPEPETQPDVAPEAESKPRRPRPKRGSKAADAPAEAQSPAQPEAREARPEATLDAQPSAAELQSAKPAGGRRGGRERRRVEPSLGVNDLAAAPLPEIRAGRSGPALEAPERLPRLRGCLAWGVTSDGEQRLACYRQGLTDDEPTVRVLVRLHQQVGWVDGKLDRHLPASALREAGGDPVEVPVGYLRRRVDDARAQNDADGRPLPADAEALLTWIGNGRRTDTRLDLPDDLPAMPSSDDANRLLDHPLFRGWQIALKTDGDAVAQWNNTRRKRSASRQRRRLIDELCTATAQVHGPALVERLQQQAALLERAAAPELAALALAFAADLAAGAAAGRPAGNNELLRELVYRGFVAGSDEHWRVVRRRRDHQRTRRRRRQRAHSRFAQGLRRR